MEGLLLDCPQGTYLPGRSHLLSPGLKLSRLSLEVCLKIWYPQSQEKADNPESMAGQGQYQLYPMKISAHAIASHSFPIG